MHQTRPIALGSAGSDPSLLGVRLWLQQNGTTAAASTAGATLSAPLGLDSAPHGAIVVAGLPGAPPGGSYQLEIFLLATPDAVLAWDAWGPGAVATPSPSVVQARGASIGPQRIVVGRNAAPVEYLVQTDMDPTGATATFDLFARGVRAAVVLAAPAGLAASGSSPSWRLTLSWSPDPESTAALRPGWHFGRFYLAPSGGGMLPVPADEALGVYVAGSGGGAE